MGKGLTVSAAAAARSAEVIDEAVGVFRMDALGRGRWESAWTM